MILNWRYEIIVPVNFRDRGIADGIAESLIWNGISSVKRKKTENAFLLPLLVIRQSTW